MIHPFHTTIDRSTDDGSTFDRITRALAAARTTTAVLVTALAASMALVPLSSAHAQCNEMTAQHYLGGGTVACPCFVAGEQVGVYFDAGQITSFPIHITKVGIGWGSALGGQGQSIEEAFHIYEAGLPNPGTPAFTQLGPVLTDGAINEYDITIAEVYVGVPFAVTLEFYNPNAGDPFAGTVVHDGNGCTGGGHNLIYAIPGGWVDACLAGITGDWIFYVKYTECVPTGIGDERIASSVPVFLAPASPNPFTASTELELFLQEGGQARVAVYDVQGRKVANLADRYFDAGTNLLSWDGSSGGAQLPSGVYFVEVRANNERAVRKVLLQK